MQAKSKINSSVMYNDCMPAGRPTTFERTQLGEKILLARKEKGMTQKTLAESLGVTQRVIAHWELRPVALKPEQLDSLATALDVSADFLLGREKPVARGNGPKGKAKYMFERVSKLPRAQQDKILDLLEPFVSAHAKD